MKERIDNHDVHGDVYALLRGVQLARESTSAVEDGAVIGILARDSNLIAMTSQQATEAIAFLLAALPPDAAREALAKRAPGYEFGECDACQKTTLLTPTGSAGAVSICLPCLETAHQETDAHLRARTERAEKRLERVLTLSEREIGDAVACGMASACVRLSDDAIDISMKRQRGVTLAVLSLIRSRATEGAEEPTGATT